jgi:hypothetical protein
MKTREGFVSNSSSSSFVVVATKDAHERALAKMKEEARKLVERSVSFKKFGTQNIVLAAGNFENEGGYCHSQYFSKVDKKAKGMSDEDARAEKGDDNEDEYENPWTDAMQTYMQILSKDKEASVSEN